MLVQREGQPLAKLFPLTIAPSSQPTTMNLQRQIYNLESVSFGDLTEQIELQSKYKYKYMIEAENNKFGLN